MEENWTIAINTSGAAFEESPTTEIARILRDLADRFERDGIPPEHLRDLNGNRVGYVSAATAVAIAASKARG